MTLASITRGRKQKPYRVLVHGVDGVGKSTFGAGAPGAVFFGPEDGTNHLDVARFPAPETWEDALDAVTTLTTDPGEFKTLVIDSLDWLEPMVWAHVCKTAGVASIEEVLGGFGKGYNAALDVWRLFLAALERLQREREMHVVAIAHSHIKMFKNPQGDDFERYILKLNDKAAGLWREWAEEVMFAQFETFAVKDKAKRVRGVSSGARLLWTQRTAAYDAKNRYSCPERLPLSWDDFDAAVKAGRPADPAALRAEIERKAAELGDPKIETYSKGYVAAHADDAEALAILNDRLNGKLAEKREQEAAQS